MHETGACSIWRVSLASSRESWLSEAVRRARRAPFGSPLQVAHSRRRVTELGEELVEQHALSVKVAPGALDGTVYVFDGCVVACRGKEARRHGPATPRRFCARRRSRRFVGGRRLPPSQPPPHVPANSQLLRAGGAGRGTWALVRRPGRCTWC